LLYNRARLDPSSIQVVENKQSTSVESWAIRIPTAETGESEKEIKKKRTNLDFIFNGAKSHHNCRQLEAFLLNQNLSEVEVQKQMIDQHSMLKVQELSQHQYLRDLFKSLVIDSNTFTEDEFWARNQNLLPDMKQEFV